MFESALQVNSKYLLLLPALFTPSATSSNKKNCFCKQFQQLENGSRIFSMRNALLAIRNAGLLSTEVACNFETCFSKQNIQKKTAVLHHWPDKIIRSGHFYNLFLSES